jgi:hypothetical protein
MVWLHFMVVEESRSIPISRLQKIVRKLCPQMRHWFKWRYWMHSIWIWLFRNIRKWVTFYSLKGKRETVQGNFLSFTGYSSLLIGLGQHAYCLVHLVIDVQVSRLSHWRIWWKNISLLTWIKCLLPSVLFVIICGDLMNGGKNMPWRTRRRK